MKQTNKLGCKSRWNQQWFRYSLLRFISNSRRFLFWFSTSRFAFGVRLVLSLAKIKERERESKKMFFWHIKKKTNLEQNGLFLYK